ncbi:MAG: hypothetical protein HQ463_03570 [Bacteroidetes bacterium]|nr:hypothetical protein [Bacteroidota bacterium]
MNNNSEDYLFMFLKVRNHYLANTVVMDAVPTLQAEYTTYNTRVDTYMTQLSNSTADTSGYTLDKESKRKNLEALGLKISNALTAHAVANNNAINRKLADYPTSYFTLANAEDLIARTKALYLLATPLLGVLLPFGASSADVSNLNLAINSFVLANPQGSIAIDIRKENAALAEETRLLIVDQLTNKIDVLVRVFETSNAMLYGTYQSARALDITGTPTAPAFEGTATGATPHLITNIPFTANRELRLNIIGGNAIWGLSNNIANIEFAVPIQPSENPRLQCITIGPNGNNIMVQASNPAETITYKLWVYEEN